MLADEFIILFLSGYIFEKIEFVAKHFPAIDFVMTTLSEMINPMNAFFITFIFNYFAKSE